MIMRMKKQLIILAIAGCLVGATGCAGGYVTTQPAEVVYTRPAAPGPDYIWIDGDWGWSGGAYVWHEGRWGRPRAGHTWQRGSWQSGSRGYRWNRGHWR
jgi:WXXGXW repeat (2 copies)